GRQACIAAPAISFGPRPRFRFWPQMRRRSRSGQRLEESEGTLATQQRSEMSTKLMSLNVQLEQAIHPNNCACSVLAESTRREIAKSFETWTTIWDTWSLLVNKLSIRECLDFSYAPQIEIRPLSPQKSEYRDASIEN